jgi:UDP:flavonoid glycosyltransferase YjiC (YdhE family)
MSRYLFVFPPLVGHVSPAAGVAGELERRGHEVAWVAHRDVVGELIGDQAVVYPAGDRFLAHIRQHLPERDTVSGLAAVRFLWEKVLIPLALDMADPVRSAVDDFDPHVVVTDQQTFAGAIVAAERGLRWAASACSTAALLDPALPAVAEWMGEKLAGLCRDVGASELVEAGFDPRHSPHLVLEYSTPALTGEPRAAPTSTAFVGPIMPEWADHVAFPWDWLDRHDTNVVTTLGTLSHGIGDRFLRTVLDAVDGQPYGVVMVADDERLPRPANVLIRPFVPLSGLLPRTQAMVCHAGHNTALGALAFGVPLVCAPIRDDQPITAQQVVRAGAGVRLRHSRATSADVAAAIDTVLHDPSYRAAARDIAESFAAAGGAGAAADSLEALVVTASGATHH